MDKEFKKSFINMFNSTTPDVGMYAEVSNSVDRYIGDGDEPFMYSIRMRNDLSSPREQIQNEIELARICNRKTIEWKTYEILNQEKVEEELIAIGAQLRSILRLMYYPVDSKEFSISKQNKIIEVTPENFDNLLDVIEDVFKHRSSWIKDGLGQEVSLTPNLVKAYLCFVDGNLASTGWIKKYNKIGNLFGGGTIEKFRGQGAYQSLVQARYKFAQENDINFLISDCTPDSERVLHKLGFKNGGIIKKWNITL